jgi:hypothetical protein
MTEINRVVISSGHSLKVRGAAGVLDEVDEARKVVEHVADELGSMGIDVVVFHDDTSTTQGENLETIVAFHNEQERDLDVSVHFNAYVETKKPMGTECLYVSQAELAGQMAGAIASVGFINRGPKKRTDLYFLNKTDMPAILIEVCFVDSQADADLYEERFDRVCYSIASAIAGEETDVRPPSPPEPDVDVLMVRGKVSHFGGPDDTGVTPSEGLAFIYDAKTAPWLFGEQPPGTTGLARRLDPNVPYIAMRFDYDIYSKEQLASMDLVALVTAPKTGRSFLAWPADWGPHVDTGRVADISPGLMQALGIQTDDDVEVVFPVSRKEEGIA